MLPACREIWLPGTFLDGHLSFAGGGSSAFVPGEQQRQDFRLAGRLI